MGREMVAQEAALPLEGGVRNAKTASEECSTALWKQLVAASPINGPGKIDTEEVVRRIARSPALLAEAAEVAPRLAARRKPIGRDALIAELIRLAPVFGVADRAAAEWATLFDCYVEVLGEQPPEAIRHACSQWLARGKFYPKPAELLELAEPKRLELAMVEWRARQAAEYREKMPPPSDPPEVKARIRQEWDEMKASLGVRAMPTAPRPAFRSPQAMAAEMREKAAQRPAQDFEEPI